MPFLKRNHFLLASILFAVILSVMIPQSDAQTGVEKPPVFRINVQNGYVPVAVSDSLGRHVTGLRKEHF